MRHQALLLLQLELLLTELLLLLLLDGVSMLLLEPCVQRPPLGSTLLGLMTLGPVRGTGRWTGCPWHRSCSGGAPSLAWFRVVHMQILLRCTVQVDGQLLLGTALA